MLAKRIISLFLIFLAVLTVLPTSADAADPAETDAKTPVYIWVRGNTKRCIPVYQEGDDLLFSANDLADLLDIDALLGV
jgi:hypothetical protein